MNVSGKKDESKEGEAWTKETSLFPRKSAVPAKSKTLAFNYDKDILCRLEMDDSVALSEGSSTLLAVYNITGVAKFAEETASKGLGSPKVHLSFSLDSSGIAKLNKAEATVELPPEPEDEEDTKDEKNTTESESLEKNTTSEDELKDDKEVEETNEPAKEASGEVRHNVNYTKKQPIILILHFHVQGSDSANSTDSTNSSKGDNDSSDKKDKKKTEKKKDSEKKKKVKKDTTLRRILKINENPELLTPAGWTPEIVKEAQTRLRTLAEADKLRMAKEAALNELEGYIYKVKNRIMDDEKELSKVSTDEQREEVIKLANDAEEWLYEDGRNQEVATYKEKQKAIKDKAEAIFFRFSEMTDRPAAVAKAREQLKAIKPTVAAWGESKPWISSTDEEKEKLLDHVEKALAWFDEKESAQKLKKSTEDAPVFQSIDVKPQLKMVVARDTTTGEALKETKKTRSSKV